MPALLTLDEVFTRPLLIALQFGEPVRPDLRLRPREASPFTLLGHTTAHCTDPQEQHQPARWAGENAHRNYDDTRYAHQAPDEIRQVHITYYSTKELSVFH